MISITTLKVHMRRQQATTEPTLNRTTLGAYADRFPLGAGLHLAISPRMCRRPSPAWAMAFRMMSSVIPSTCNHARWEGVREDQRTLLGVRKKAMR